MSKLTKSQRFLLEDMRHSPLGKSGGYWCDLGYPMVTLYALERKGLVASRTQGFSGSRHWRWSITEAGMKAIYEGGDE